MRAVPALAALFRAAEPELALTALVGAPPELIDRILGRFAAPEASTVRHKLDHPGPIRLSDVDGARDQIADLARRLAREGRIDVVLVSKVDRISRNLSDLLGLVETLKEWNVDMVCASQSTPVSSVAWMVRVRPIPRIERFTCRPSWFADTRTRWSHRPSAP